MRDGMRCVGAFYRSVRWSISSPSVLSRYSGVRSVLFPHHGSLIHMLLLARSSPLRRLQPHRMSGGERAWMCLVHVLEHSIPSVYEPMASDDEWTRQQPNGPDNSKLATRCVASWTAHHTRPLATQHQLVQSLRRQPSDTSRHQKTTPTNDNQQTD